MSSKIKVDTIENVAGSGNVSLGSGHNLVVPGSISGGSISGANVTAAANGVPLIVNSTNSNNLKIHLQNNGSTTSYVGGIADGLVFGKADATQIGRLDGDGLKLGTDSAAANALDDYEEGTWTATLVGSTTNPTTPVTNTQKYMKVGRQVTIEIKFTNVDTTGAAGGIRVTGLPYPCDSVVAAAGGIMLYSKFTFATGHLSAYIPGSTLQIYNSRTASAWTTANHSAGAGFYFWGTFVYHTNS